MTGVGNQASDGCSEPAFSPAVRWFGLLGLVGLVAFASSLIVLHLTSSNIDLMDHYVSNLANQPLGWVFMAGAFVHSWGNLALTLGLRAALNPGGLRTWAVLLFGLAALGILLAAVFPIEAPDQVPGVSGRITIRARIEQDSLLQKHLILTYKDDGRGMTEHTVANIYKPFFTNARHNGGTGLGMHICYNLAIDVLRGSIDCESKLGKGTTFVLKFPIQ